MILTIIRNGARVVNRNQKILWIWYASNLVFALVILAPMAVWINRTLQHSLYADSLLHSFDPQWLAEFFLQNQSAQLIALPPLLLAMAGVYGLWSTFLTGGVLSGFRGGKREGFFAGCGRWFWPFVRVLLLSLLFYVFLLGVDGVLAQGISKIA